MERWNGEKGGKKVGGGPTPAARLHHAATH